MFIRHLVKLELAALFVSFLILSTFIQVRLPFVSFVLPQMPDTWLWFESSYMYLGTYAGTFQLPMVFLCLVLLDGTLATLTLGLYLLIGLLFLPIFYYGGGLAYLHQATFGYLLILLPASWLWLMMVKRHRRRILPLKRYLSASLMVLGLIQLFGGLYAALALDLIPLSFILGFALPQLAWQAPTVVFIVLVTWQFQVRWRRAFPPKSAPSLVKPSATDV